MNNVQEALEFFKSIAQPSLATIACLHSQAAQAPTFREVSSSRLQQGQYLDSLIR